MGPLVDCLLWAISSVGERFPHTEEATGSIPVSPTIHLPDFGNLSTFVFLLITPLSKEETCHWSFLGRMHSQKVTIRLISCALWPLFFFVLSCTSNPSPSPLPPSKSDLELLEAKSLCEPKAVTLTGWKGTKFKRISWGTGEQLFRPAFSGQPNHDRFLFFNEENILVGAAFDFGEGLSLEPYPDLRDTLSKLPPALEYYLDTSSILQGGKPETAVLYRTGDETSTIRYTVSKRDDDPILLVASIAIDPYEPLFSKMERPLLKERLGLQGIPSPAQSGKHSDDAREFLANQQFARGQAAWFKSCGKRHTSTAIDAYRKAIAHNLADKQRLSEAHHILGLALKEKGQLEEAQTHIEEALVVRPNVPTVVNSLGTVLAERGEKAEAIAKFEQAIVLKPNYARARFNLAEALEDVNPRRAIEEYETYLVLAEGVYEEQARSALARSRVERLKGK